MFLISGGFLLAFQDALVKFSSDWTSFWQFQALRSGFNLLLLVTVPVFLGIRLSSLIPKNVGWVAFRTSFLILCMFCFFCAAPVLTFAQMTTGLYTYPVFVVILSILFLGEKLTALKFVSIALGVIGANLVLKPWDSNFSSLQIFPIMAGFFYACNLFVLKKYCAYEKPIALTAAVAIGFMLSGLLGGLFVDNFLTNESFKLSMPFISVGWPKLTALVILFAAIASVFNLSGNLFLVKAYQTSESSFLAPLDFLYLVFALFWGKVLFDTIPDHFGLFGILLIIFSSVTVAVQASKLNLTLKFRL